MLSQPNIPFFEVGRLRYDQNDTFTLIQLKDNLPVSLAGRSFIVEFCAKETSNVLYTITNDKLTKGEASISFVAADFSDQLPLSEYTVFFMEVLLEEKRDLLAWGNWKWLALPTKQITTNTPRKPADIAIQETTVPPNILSLPVIVVATAGLSSEDVGDLVPNFTIKINF